MTFKEFIASNRTVNVWVQERHMQVYVRRGNHLLGREIFACIDVASIEVDDGMRGKGLFKNFLVEVEKASKKLHRAVFVESVLEPRLIPFLLRLGYVPDPRTADTLAPSFYKLHEQL